MDMLQAALDWARDGFAVFPLWWRDAQGKCVCGLPLCDKPGKHPRVSKGFHAATKDRFKIEHWWEKWPDANIGLATGAPSGVIVLDIDEAEGVKQLTKVDGQIPHTFTVVTQNSGLHMYFRAPEQEVRSRTRFLPGLDLRGDGGYVVAPPSSGYKIVDDREPASFDWLHKILRASVFARVAKSKGPLKIPKQIPEGQRHDVLFRYACRLRHAGLEEEEILEKVRELNESRCIPPEDEDVIQRQVADVCSRYQIGTEKEAERYDELGLVERIRLELACPEADSISTRDEHWFYDNGVWTPLGDDGVAAFLHAWKNEIYETADKIKAFRPTRQKIVNVSQHLRLIDRRQFFFESRPDVLAFLNGVVFPDGTMADHSPQYRLQFMRPEEYDPEAGYEIWDAFLDVTFAGLDTEARKAVLQEFAGAALFGAAPKYEKALILVGPGANGKSVILKVLEGVMPPGSVTAIAPHDMHQEYRRATLANSMLNIVSEVPSRELKETESIKAIISGDIIEGRQIRQEEIRFRPSAAHVFAANALPEINDFTPGFRRRWIILTCPNSVVEDDQIPDLGGKLLDFELQGIVRWAVEGMLRLARQGRYTACKTSDREVMSWLRASDQIADFVEECCDLDEASWTIGLEVYNKFCIWASHTGRRRLPKRKFFVRFKHYVKPRMIKQQKGYRCNVNRIF